ncbi:MAG TPA: hypothetical protein VK553_00505 [Candidatus Nitrosopolaris rasttigaisensis]|nr:hypothetical protein [Candidatus Nitrosopolaris rasttigaisensis]
MRKRVGVKILTISSTLGKIMTHSHASIFLLFIDGTILTSILIITIPITYGQKAPSATFVVSKVMLG